MIQWLIIAAAALLSYRPVLNAGYVWDDDNYVTQNAQLRSLEGLWQIWTTPEATPQYYPLVHSTFWLEYQIWKLNPTGFHITNLAIHIANAFLFCGILRRLNVPGASFAALVFAIHPVHVESVAWITERKNVLSLLFYLLTMRTFLFSGKERRSLCHAGVILLFACALLSKTVTATLPATLLVVSLWKELPIDKTTGRLLVLMILIAIPLAFLTVFLEKHHVGASGATWQFSWKERLLIAGRSIWFHLGKLIWPSPLAFIYPKFELDTSSWSWIAAPGAVIAAIILMFSARKIKVVRGLLIAFLLFCGTLFPALGFFNIYPMQYTFVADHYQYHASLPMIGLLAAGLETATSRIGRYGNHVRISTQVIVIGFTIPITSAAVERFANAESLWLDTLEKNDSASIAMINLGEVYRRQGRLFAACQQYRRAMLVAPGDPLPATNLAGVLISLGNLSQAENDLLEIIRRHPDHGNAHYNLGLVQSKTGRNSEALHSFHETLKHNPAHAPAHNAIGIICFQAKDFTESVRRFSKAHDLSPLDPEFLCNWGAALVESGNSKSAIPLLRRALELNPSQNEAKSNLARALSLVGNCEEAVEIARAILKGKPNDEVAVETLKRCQ